uniref:uncharacterized protein LOC100186474 isoform X2 n=1 Tax=Ciona intestinalis TaxID=7719 RepID=UPI0005218158|nr:uncharacterized protein LOC100186474 isoform X2 [Ciona intestinalis]|eukprot:XP_009858353.1 uncharacterized protein LOC100186474 isoform X2 [Ciona intestinalis]
MSGNYKEKYKFLKRKLKILLYEHESLSIEVEKAQRKLLQVSRDNSFLLDRLLQYEQVPVDTSDDSDATLSSDSEPEQPPPSKRRMQAKVLDKTIKLESKEANKQSKAELEAQATSSVVSNVTIKEEKIDEVDVVFTKPTEDQVDDHLKNLKTEIDIGKDENIN